MVEHEPCSFYLGEDHQNMILAPPQGLQLYGRENGHVRGWTDRFPIRLPGLPLIRPPPHLYFLLPDPEGLFGRTRAYHM